MKQHRNLLAALLMATATLMAVSCSKDDENNNGNNNDNAKVTRIYKTSSALYETLNSSTGKWDTTIFQENPRRLSEEYFYTGDRLDSIRMNSQPRDYVIVFSYDADGRLSSFTSNYGEFCEYQYDSDGKVRQLREITMTSSTDTFSVKTIDYTWASGHIQRMECSTVYDTSSLDETHLYTWNGDQLVSTICYTVNGNGYRDTAAYTFEFSNVKNPFYGSVFWQRNSSLYSFTHDGIEGFCPYVLKHIIGGVTNPEEIRFDPTTSGGRLSGLHEETFHENTSIRLHTTTDYEFEY